MNLQTLFFYFHKIKHQTISEKINKGKKTTILTNITIERVHLQTISFMFLKINTLINQFKGKKQIWNSTPKITFKRVNQQAPFFSFLKIKNPSINFRKKQIFRDIHAAAMLLGTFTKRRVCNTCRLFILNTWYKALMLTYIDYDSADTYQRCTKQVFSN